ncbi:MAG: amidohydrolase family protein [Minisyncoccia bacterium]
MARSWNMPAASNLHTHFRHSSDARFKIAVAECAKLYDFATAMPNLGKKDLIRTPEGALAYKAAIEAEGCKHNPRFFVNVPLYLEPDTDPETVRAGVEKKAWIAAKLYPKGGTTQSAEGVDFLRLGELYPVFRMMEELGMLLLVHAEPTHDDDEQEIDPWDREREAIDYLERLIRDFPRLSIVFEHISSEEGAQFVRTYRNQGAFVGATVAPQYLVWNRGKLLSGGMNPAYYSIPVLKREEDRQALINFIWHGYGFLGTDSAPHTVPNKSKPCGCAGGVFNEPTSLFVYFRIFEEEGRRRAKDDWFDRFVRFACSAGPRFYGVQAPALPIRSIIEEPWEVPHFYGEGENAIIPMLAGETIPYRLV